MLTKVKIVLIFFLPGFLFTCAVCYGNPDSPLSHGMNMGVLTLMSVIGFVLLIVAYSIISISIRAKKINKS